MLRLQHSTIGWTNLTAFFGGGGGGQGTHASSILIVVLLAFNSGDCVTLAGRGEVCALNSVAAECNSVATRCSCNPGYFNTNALTCAGN